MLTPIVANLPPAKPMLTRLLVYLLPVALAPIAAAGDLHKCLAADGQSIYTTEPCPVGSKPVWTQNVEPDSRPSPPPPAPLQHFQPAPQVRYRNVYQPPERVSLCDQVRAQVDAEREIVGLRRTYAMLQRWDDRIRRACKN